MASLREEIESRRTFAIISHPDAGKTTLTEKLLLYGGAIQTAGSVKGKQSAKHAVGTVFRSTRRQVKSMGRSNTSTSSKRSFLASTDIPFSSYLSRAASRTGGNRQP